MRVMEERGELRECWRGMSGGTAGGGGWWECWIGSDGGSAGEGEVVKVLERFSYK